MEEAENLINLDGSGKKTQVLSMLKVELGEDLYNRNYLLIRETIDLVVDISKNGFQTTINTRTKQFKKDFRKILSCCK
jgi:hypothetical protein